MTEKFDILHPPEEYLKAMEILNSDGDRDADAFLKYMGAAEEKGFDMAIYSMGLEYYVGDLLPKNMEEARKRFQRLSDMGYTNINLLYNQVWGDGICRLYRRKAFECLAHGHSLEDACARMKSFGVPEYDIDAARLVLSDPEVRELLDSEEVEASALSCEVSSVARRNGIHERYMNEVFEDYLIGVGLLDPFISFDVCVRLSDVDDDVEDVLRRAEEGDPDAQYEMGMRYRMGDGVFDDEHESLRWLSKAADNGHVEAMFQMGVSFDMGIGVCSDEYVAEEWYKKAAEHGHEEAKKLVEDMRKFREGLE